MSATDNIKVRVALAKALLSPCLMCAGQPDLAALFFPDASETWGARPGKTRMIAYSLCDQCKDTHSLTECEETLAHRMGVTT